MNVSNLFRANLVVRFFSDYLSTFADAPIIVLHERQQIAFHSRGTVAKVHYLFINCVVFLIIFFFDSLRAINR